MNPDLLNKITHVFNQTLEKLVHVILVGCAELLLFEACAILLRLITGVLQSIQEAMLNVFQL